LLNLPGFFYFAPPPPPPLCHTTEHTYSLSQYMQASQHNFYHQCNLRKATGGHLCNEFSWTKYSYVTLLHSVNHGKNVAKSFVKISHISSAKWKKLWGMPCTNWRKIGQQWCSDGRKPQLTWQQNFVICGFYSIADNGCSLLGYDTVAIGK
jgi:hypothetical protein